MDETLNEIETRVLGSLLEKETTTPEYYPLSLNALLTACNQKTNREPVMSLSEDDVLRAIDSLKSRRLMWKLETAGGRVPKFEQNFSVHFQLDKAQTALMCVLMLRGPQTVGEIRGRTTRMHEFRDLAHVEQTLETLIKREERPLATQLPRLPGRKEFR
jgi:uncharacterized protein